MTDRAERRHRRGVVRTTRPGLPDLPPETRPPVQAAPVAELRPPPETRTSRRRARPRPNEHCGSRQGAPPPLVGIGRTPFGGWRRQPVGAHTHRLHGVGLSRPNQVMGQGQPAGRRNGHISRLRPSRPDRRQESGPRLRREIGGFALGKDKPGPTLVAAIVHEDLGILTAPHADIGEGSGARPRR